MDFTRRTALCCLFTQLLLVGCSRDLGTQYGLRRPTGSVGGTEVLAELFKKAGHTVSGWSRFSPRLNTKGSCIVWFSQSMQGPSKETREWIESWLQQAPNRTFVYVGRDYDAAVDYWWQIREGTKDDEFRELSRQLADARDEYNARKLGLTETEDAGWFTIDRTQPEVTVSKLQGSEEWLREVDTSKVHVKLSARFRPDDQAEPLLSDGGDVLVARRPIGNSQLIAVTNGSFLLNLPLANRENRKLAAALVNEIGPAPQNVVFLESRLGDPSIYEEEPQEGRASLFRYFDLAPLNLILLHLAFIGAVFLFARSPIFGIPSVERHERQADFGAHVEALGTLLEQTRDTQFANNKLRHFENLTHHDAQRTAPATQKPAHARANEAL